MKRNAVSNSWQAVQEQKFAVGTILIGLVAGSIYAIAVKDQQALWFVVNQYMVQDGQIKGYEMCKSAFLLYARNLLVIWGLGLWYLTLPLTLVVLFFVSFSYGFAVCGFVLLYGLMGTVVGGLMVGVQSSILIWTYLYVIRYSKKYCAQEQRIQVRKYGQILVGAVIMVGGVALLDGYIQPLLVWIVRQML